MADSLQRKQTLPRRSSSVDLNQGQRHQAAMHALRAGDLGRAEPLLLRLHEELPHDLDVLYGLAQIGFISGRSDLVIETMQRCIKLDPKDGSSYHNLGNALRSKGHHDEAIAALRTAIRLMPNPADAHNTLGLTLKDLGRMQEAVASFRKAVALNPSFSMAHSNQLLFMSYLAETSPEKLFKEHRRWAKGMEAPLRHSIHPHSNDRTPDRRLRIGYVSADLRLHSVAYFLLPLFENHDREQFHITAYSNCAVGDAITRRLQACVDAWCGIAGASDEQVAARIRADHIDILVDLAGHTAGHRLQVFARRPAPLQITWLGYSGSTGLNAMDYRCSDPLVDPPGDASRFSSEQLLRLPHTTWCYSPLSGAPDVAQLPALTASGVSFGSFNNFGKISALTLDLWASILTQTPGSRLVLKNVALRSAAVVRRVQDWFASRGIAADRLALLSHADSLLDHLNHYNSIDLSLDTFPYHGTTTTCEALWMGVPTITLAGRNHVSRPGVSLLANVGLADLIASNKFEYVDKAVQLAGNLSELAELRAGLRQRMLASPLMNAPAFARDMENGYRQVWRQWCAQAPPA